MALADQERDEIITEYESIIQNWRGQTDLIDDLAHLLDEYIKDDKIIEELKEWQALTGQFAGWANSLANIVLDENITDNERYYAEHIIEEVSDYLIFREDE